MSLIALNGNSNIPQPSELTEEYIQMRIVKSTITGITRQIWLNQKKQVTMKLEAISQSDYNLINSYINGGNPITYTNASSGWNFTGFASTATDQYLRGASMLRTMTITLLEI